MLCGAGLVAAAAACARRRGCGRRLRRGLRRADRLRWVARRRGGAAAGDGGGAGVLALRRSVALKGIVNGPRERFEEMLRFYERRRIHPVVDQGFAFDEAREALEYLLSGAHFGKVVIKVTDD